MADHCVFCDYHRPPRGTNMLVLGDQWLEFCSDCGERETLTNGETGETLCIADVFELGGTKLKNRPSPRQRKRMLKQRRKAMGREAMELRAIEARKAAHRASLKGGLGDNSGPLFSLTPA
tara:strand:- start:442 stop:801 length:360 start_codon:yes stop_codon:yes gene_type:complete